MFQSTPTLLAQGGSGNAVLITFLIYIIAVFVIAGLSNKLLQSRNFLSEYFLGSRGLGVWAFALTLAATSSSGGSFMGFPSKIYSHGWILALWIGSYMVVPICVMGLLGKRINQVARTSGAITIPDVLRDRFNNVSFGLISVALIIFFMTFNLVAQFKAGSEILRTLLGPIDAFNSMVDSMPDWFSSLSSQTSDYLFCLVVFGIAVIVYTTYGGFHAVVWTDVMQGIVMVVGVLIMLPLAINQATSAIGDKDSEKTGMALVTEEMSEMLPPRFGTATLSISSPLTQSTAIPPGTWIWSKLEDGTNSRLFKTRKRYVLEKDSPKVEQAEVLEIISAADIKRASESLIASQNSNSPHLMGIVATDAITEKYVYGADKPGAYVTAPGPHRTSPDGFLPLSLAISFFFMWAISGSGQPSNMVRLMAFKDTVTLRRSIFTVALYYSAIYFPLVIIFCCARILVPGMESEPDRIMPQIAVVLTENIGMGWLAGLLIAAPFAAVMSTVDSFLLMISSALVRDIYQRNINEAATEAKIKKLSYFFTLIVGLGALVGAMYPPEFLQDIIVYTGSGLAAAFLAPVVYALYWPRSNYQGCIAAMLGGFGTHLAMYFVGFINGDGFSPYRLMGTDPIIVGLVASFVIGFVMTLGTPPPDERVVRKYFYKKVEG